MNDLIASVLMVWLFPRQVASLSLLYLLVGDVAAALIGRKFGKQRIWGKSLEGSLAFLAAAILVSFWVPGIPAPSKLLAALGATIVEALPIPFDDNMTVPLAAGCFLLVLS